MTSKCAIKIVRYRIARRLRAALAVCPNIRRALHFSYRIPHLTHPELLRGSNLLHACFLIRFYDEALRDVMIAALCISRGSYISDAG